MVVYGESTDVELITTLVFRKVYKRGQIWRLFTSQLTSETSIYPWLTVFQLIHLSSVTWKEITKMTWPIVCCSQYQLRLAVTMLSPRTLANVGQWPKTEAIQKITKIVVFAGTIIDSMRITYQIVNSTTPITIQHGGPGGVQNLSFDIGGNILLLVYDFLFTYWLQRTKISLLFMVPSCWNRPNLVIKSMSPRWICVVSIITYLHHSVLSGCRS